MLTETMAIPRGPELSSESNGLYGKPPIRGSIEKQRFFRGSVNCAWWFLPSVILGALIWARLLGVAI